MKLSVDGVEIASVTPMEWKALMGAYRKSEEAAGRAVPQYALEALALVLGGWLLKKLGDEIWKRTTEYKAKKAARTAAAEAKATATDRHAEILAKLESLANGQSPGQLDELLRKAAEHHMKVVIRLENDAERDLADAIRKAVPDAVVESA